MSIQEKVAPATKNETKTTLLFAKSVVGKGWKQSAYTAKELKQLFSTLSVRGEIYRDDAEKDNPKYGAAISFASFMPDSKGSRAADNIKSVTGIPFDFDAGEVSFDDMYDHCLKQKYEFYIYHTHSNMSSKKGVICERFRVLFPYASEYPIDGVAGRQEHYASTGYFAVAGHLKLKHFDITSNTVERANFLHSAPETTKHLAQFKFGNVGNRIDPTEIIPKYVKPVTEEKATAIVASNSTAYPDTYFETFNLSVWMNEYSHSFEMAELLKDRNVKTRKRQKGGYAIHCPDRVHFEHGSWGAFVTDGNDEHGFNIGCSHTTCKEKNRSHVDRLVTLLKDEIISVEDLENEDYGGGEIETPLTDREVVTLPSGFDYEGSEITLFAGKGKARKKISDRIFFTGLARDYESQEWLLVCEVTTPDGQTNEVYIQKRHAGKDTALEDLRAAGGAVYDTPGMKKVLVSVEPSQHCRLVSQGGWHNDVFVLTGDQVSVFGDGTDEKIIYRQSGQLKPAFNVGGTLEDWKTHIATPVQGNNLLQFSLCAAFAAPLMTPMGIDGGGFHLVGGSSIGKTIALKIFGSVFGGAKYITSYRGTDNAMESVCEMHNDCGLAIDEISQADTASFGETVYMMANGEGKNRANNFGDSKGTKTWRNMILSSGETTIAEKMEENKFGAPIKGGQSVRLVDLYADARKEMGIVEELNGAATSKEFVVALSDASKAFYGTAIRAFLEHFVKNGLHASQEFQDKRKAFIGAVVPSDADGQIGRIADRFALCAIAGEAAIEAGALPWAQGEAIKVCSSEFQKFLSIRGLGSFEVVQGIAAVEKFLVVNGARFQNHNGEDAHINNLVGWYKDSGHTGVREYYIPSSNWSEVCGGYSPDAVAKALADRGELVANTDGKLTKKYRPKGLKPIWCRVLVQDGRTKKEIDDDKQQLIVDFINKTFAHLHKNTKEDA